MRLWVDDERPMPDSYDFRVECYEDAILILETYEVTKISLDHDLGTEETGYDIACWIERESTRGLPRIEWNLHTANPVGREKMKMAMEMADRYWQALEAMCKRHESYPDICFILGEDRAMEWYTCRVVEHGDRTVAQMLLDGDKEEVEKCVNNLKERFDD